MILRVAYDFIAYDFTNVALGEPVRAVRLT